MPHKSNPDLLHYWPCCFPMLHFKTQNAKHRPSAELLWAISFLNERKSKTNVFVGTSTTYTYSRLYSGSETKYLPQANRKISLENWGCSAWTVRKKLPGKKKKKLSSSHKCKFRLSAGRACRYTGKQHTTVFCDTLSRAIYFRDAIMPALNSDSMYFSNDQVVICQP